MYLIVTPEDEQVVTDVLNGLVDPGPWGRLGFTPERVTPVASHLMMYFHHYVLNDSENNPRTPEAVSGMINHGKGSVSLSASDVSANVRNVLRQLIRAVWDANRPFHLGKLGLRMAMAIFKHALYKDGFAQFLYLLPWVVIDTTTGLDTGVGTRVPAPDALNAPLPSCGDQLDLLDGLMVATVMFGPKPVAETLPPKDPSSTEDQPPSNDPQPAKKSKSSKRSKSSKKSKPAVDPLPSGDPSSSSSATPAVTPPVPAPPRLHYQLALISNGSRVVAIPKYDSIIQLRTLESPPDHNYRITVPGTLFTDHYIRDLEYENQSPFSPLYDLFDFLGGFIMLPEATLPFDSLYFLSALVSMSKVVGVERPWFELEVADTVDGIPTWVPFDVQT